MGIGHPEIISIYFDENGMKTYDLAEEYGKLFPDTDNFAALFSPSTNKNRKDMITCHYQKNVFTHPKTIGTFRTANARS